MDIGRVSQVVKEHLDRANCILLLAPRNIDGDTIGTNVATYEWLSRMGKKVILYSPVEIDESYMWMPHMDKFVYSFDPYEVDLIFSSDTAVKELFMSTPDEEILFSRNLPWINLDHHISNTKYGTVNILDYSSTCCSMILYRIIKELGGHVSPEMATHMMMSIYMDSGSFIHPNTSNHTYRIAGELMEAGAETLKVATHFFRSNREGKLKLWGIVLDRMQLTDDGVLISMVQESDFAITGTSRDDLEGLADMMNTVQNKVCVLLSEDGKGNVKGSLRTMAKDVDLNVIAQRFGGGGHRLAAGFTLKNTSMSNLMQWKLFDGVM